MQKYCNQVLTSSCSCKNVFTVSLNIYSLILHNLSKLTFIELHWEICIITDTNTCITMPNSCYGVERFNFFSVYFFCVYLNNG